MTQLLTSNAEDIRAVQDQLVVTARTDFYTFAILMFPVLHNGRQMTVADYIDLISRLLEQIEHGRYRNVIVNLPPRHLKSILISVLYPAWLLGRRPGTRIIGISYSDDLAHHLSSQMREVMQSRLYRRIFPSTHMRKTAVDMIGTTHSGYRYSTAVGSNITGFGADYIIIDDPMQPDEAVSERTKQQLRDWYASSVVTRLDNPAKGRIILVMHRLAPDDLSSTLAPGADFHLSLPLVAEKLEGFKTDARMLMGRNPGEPLHPKRMALLEIESLKKTLPAHVFASQYQQRPTHGGSGMLSIDRFQRFNLGAPPPFAFTVHSWDVGATISGNASVLSVLGIRLDEHGKPHAYLLDVQRLKLELPDLKKVILAKFKTDNPALVVLDSVGVGMGLWQELNRISRRFFPATGKRDEPIERADSAGIKPGMSKIERFGHASLVVGDGRVHIPGSAPWLEAFLYEIASFPNIADKDQVDSFSQIVGNLPNVVHFAKVCKDRD